MTRRFIRANLRLLPASEGGRSSPVESGYRSLARFEGSTLDFGFELEPDAGHLVPGDSGTGHLSFWAAEELPELSAGQAFELREGSRVVGHGTVLEPTS
jgi:translation elongation factor EF-Tu-like GTPase